MLDCSNLNQNNAFMQKIKNWCNKRDKLKKYAPFLIGLILTPIFYIIFKKFKIIYYSLIIYYIFFNSTTKTKK